MRPNRLLLLLACVFSSASFAKTLEDRIGFGLSYHHFNSTTALSLRYFPSNYITANAIFGFTTDASKSTTMGIKLARNLNLEENMNFYAGLSGYVLSSKDTLGVQTTGIEFDVLLGAEFFLQGLPHLGFLFEAGLALQSMQAVVFKTTGGALASAGIHYYF